MWVTGKAPSRVGNADQVQHLGGARPRSTATQTEMLRQALRDLPSHSQHRVQCCHRLLEHDGDLTATQSPQLRLGKRHQVTPLPRDTSGGLRNIWQQTENGAQRQAFARTGFADDAEYLAGSDIEADVLHGRDVSDPHGEIANRQKWRAHVRRRSRLAMPSPSRLKLMPASTIARPGKMDIHQAVVMKFLPSAISTPHSAVGGCAPSPR